MNGYIQNMNLGHSSSILLLFLLSNPEINEKKLLFFTGFFLLTYFLPV
jgi:hypothetical protein